MNPILKNILVVIAGLLIGSAANMAVVVLGSFIIPAPSGANATDTESMQNVIHLYEAKHYIFPLLAHAVGTLVGAFIAARFGASRKFMLAISIGVFFLIGGITVAYLLGTPALPTAIDLIFAYIPMAILGWKIGR